MGTYSVPMPLDDDDFLRRECPHCHQKFKWHDGSTADRLEGQVDPAVYHCPCCGVSAGPNAAGFRDLGLDGWFSFR
jgi:endogenous inhibitor of DNA gyrase (YacG/DUF329 family)